MGVTDIEIITSQAGNPDNGKQDTDMANVTSHETTTRADGMPASKDERHLRRLLCMARERMPYMDDGEASTSDGLDYMRMDLAELEDKFLKRNMTRFVDKCQQLKDAGIEHTFESPFMPEHELSGVLADLKAGHPFDEVCLATITRVRDYLVIVNNPSWLQNLQVLAGDVFMLCSDGLNKMVNDVDIASILMSDCDGNVKVERLIQKALDNDGLDNITVVIVTAKGTTMGGLFC